MTYITIEDLVAYSPVTISNPTADLALGDAVSWAEGMFISLTGSHFDQQTHTNVQPQRAFFSRMGELVLIARERAPVTAVSAVSVRIPNTLGWTTLSWNTDDILLPPIYDPPDPNAWRVTIFPNNILMQRVAADNLWVKWTYTGGYSPIPPSLHTVLLRMAWWKYKLREAPLGRINSEMFGTREIIQALPNDVRMDLLRWSRLAVG